MFAHYYQGTWGGDKKKAFTYSEQQAKSLSEYDHALVCPITAFTAICLL